MSESTDSRGVDAEVISLLSTDTGEKVLGAVLDRSIADHSGGLIKACCQVSRRSGERCCDKVR